MRNSINTICFCFLLLPPLLPDASASASSVSPMLLTEVEALYSVIKAFAGSSFNGSDLYPDPCGWTPVKGFSCDLYGDFWFVTVATIGPIEDNSLECDTSAEISDSLFEFKHLKSVSFSNCFRRHISIPSEKWRKLAGSLETLEFRGNPGLTGRIPSSLGSLSKLSSLVLIGNNVTGELPTSLGKLNGLKQMVVSETRVSGRIPASLGGLQNLLILDLSRNSLSGTLPPEIGGLSSILKLDLSSNFLEGKLPTELGNLKALTLLDLRYNNFSGGLPQSLGGMVSMEEMLLGNNPMGGDLVASGWEALENLTILDLSNMALAGNIPQSFSGMKRLRYLALENNSLSGNVPLLLADLPCLHALHLHSNNLTGEIKFPQEFYVKMGRRFSAWNNPNLCLPVGFGHAPFGLKSCAKNASVT